MPLFNVLSTYLVRPTLQMRLAEVMSCSLQSCFRWRDDLRFSLRLGLRAVDLAEIKCRKRKEKYRVVSFVPSLYSDKLSGNSNSLRCSAGSVDQIMTNDSFPAYEPVC